MKKNSEDTHLPLWCHMISELVCQRKRFNADKIKTTKYSYLTVKSRSEYQINLFYTAYTVIMAKQQPCECARWIRYQFQYI